MALFAKITPKRIEGTTYATLTGTFNLSFSVISPAMGTAINHRFVGVTAEDLSDYQTLVLINLHRRSKFASSVNCVSKSISILNRIDVNAAKRRLVPVDC